jgi:hypothetical protein
MRELTLEEQELIAGGTDTTDLPEIVVTADPGDGGGWGDWGDWGDYGDNGDYGDGGGGGDSPPDPNCAGSTPPADWADSPEVKAALDTANKDKASVERAIDGWNTVVAAANAHGIDPALLAAIGIRESGFSNIDQPDGLGRGVFQIDLGAHPNVTEAQAHDLAFSADYAAGLLASNMASLRAEFPNFTADQLTQATAASYNFGVDDISGNPATIDVGTTGNNYGSNIMGLMGAFKEPGSGITPGAGPDNGGCN